MKSTYLYKLDHPRIRHDTEGPTSFIEIDFTTVNEEIIKTGVTDEDIIEIKISYSI